MTWRRNNLLWRLLPLRCPLILHCCALKACSVTPYTLTPFSNSHPSQFTPFLFFQLPRPRPAYCPFTLHIQRTNSFTHPFRISKSLQNLSNHYIAHRIFQSQTLRLTPSFHNLTILLLRSLSHCLICWRRLWWRPLLVQPS